MVLKAWNRFFSANFILILPGRLQIYLYWRNHIFFLKYKRKGIWTGHSKAWTSGCLQNRIRFTSFVDSDGSVSFQTISQNHGQFTKNQPKSHFCLAHLNNRLISLDLMLDTESDPLFTETDPRIRIHTKMKRIRKTAFYRLKQRLLLVA